jgi:hypothetical protein
MCSALLLVFALGCEPLYVPKAKVDALQSQVDQLRKELDSAKAAQAAPQSGRWRIEMRQGVRADTYLLDTATGRVWREYEDKKKDILWWKESPREDEPHVPDGYVLDKPAEKTTT